MRKAEIKERLLEMSSLLMMSSEEKVRWADENLYGNNHGEDIDYIDSFMCGVVSSKLKLLVDELCNS